ncbi:DUF4936 family protein [Ideonella sp. DXS29W]|uniref:DUF4936 family protein n=1 Tax=Ideonella lacteola TaxID=2984193 RepID=A0ABU9BW49_9BURK
MSHPFESGGASPTDERWWFIYYRVNIADMAAAVAMAREGQRALCSTQPGLSASLMQRPSSAASADGSPQMTLLETYRAALDWPADRVAALPAQIETTVGQRLNAWLQSPRHLEVFEPCV